MKPSQQERKGEQYLIVACVEAVVAYGTLFKWDSCWFDQRERRNIHNEEPEVTIVPLGLRTLSM